MSIEPPKVIQIKLCKYCQNSFDITDQDMVFYDKVSPIIAGKKIAIPSPTLCPDCRRQRRLAWRNERILYKRKCDLTGKDIVAMYHQDCPFPVYSPEARFSDQRDAKTYGQEFDFHTPFFQQFKTLQDKVPRLSLITELNENSPYVNLVSNSKNCHLIFGSTQCEECLYGNPYESFNCVDSLGVVKCEHCYECTDCEKLYSSLYCQNCNSSSNLKYCFGLEGCQDCLGCVGLVNTSFCVCNKQYTKEQYQKILADIDLCDPEKVKEMTTIFHDLKLKIPNKYYIGKNNQNAQGDYMYNCKNASHAFNVQDVEDVKYVTQIMEMKSCMDIDFGEFIYGQLYEYSGCFKISKSIFGHRNRIELQNTLYCSSCRNIKDCFGCANLANAQYCILNKQYTKEEYETLVPKIIDHMIQAGERGEFFPIAISPFGYNETTAYEYYPLTREQALAQGYTRMDKEYPINLPENFKRINAGELPENISDVNDDILDKAIICEVSKKPFRIIKQELEFYRRHGLPLPRKHPDVRHLDRVKLRNPRKLYDRKCDNCAIEMKTTYSPERKEIVYCEQCYNKEVYG